MEEKWIEEFKEEYLKRENVDISEEAIAAELEAFMKKKIDEMKNSDEIDLDMLELVNGGSLWKKIKSTASKIADAAKSLF